MKRESELGSTRGGRHHRTTSALFFEGKRSEAILRDDLSVDYGFSPGIQDNWHNYVPSFLSTLTLFVSFPLQAS